jgi:hypothetical protein
VATSPTNNRRAEGKQALEERALIRSQMRLGAGLIAFGALSIPLICAETPGQRGRLIG